MGFSDFLRNFAFKTTNPAPTNRFKTPNPENDLILWKVVDFTKLIFKTFENTGSGQKVKM